MRLETRLSGIRAIDQRGAKPSAIEIPAGVPTLRTTCWTGKERQWKSSEVRFADESSTRASYFGSRARDAWHVGTLIWEIFNGDGATSAASYRQLGSIPRPLSAVYGELMNPNPSLRSSCDQLLQSPFILNNPLVECLLFLEQIQVRLVPSSLPPSHTPPSTSS